MVYRCTNPSHKDYLSYGGRGISVCQRWLKFENFLEDMGARPKGFSLERINNNGNYCPSNCKWATRKEQQRNTRSNRILEHDGKRMCLAEWAEELGINHRTLRSRLQRGWTISETLSTTMHTKLRTRRLEK